MSKFVTTAALVILYRSLTLLAGLVWLPPVLPRGRADIRSEGSLGANRTLPSRSSPLPHVASNHDSPVGRWLLSEGFFRQFSGSLRAPFRACRSRTGFEGGNSGSFGSLVLLI